MSSGQRPAGKRLLWELPQSIKLSLGIQPIEILHNSYFLTYLFVSCSPGCFFLLRKWPKFSTPLSTSSQFAPWLPNREGGYQGRWEAEQESLLGEEKKVKRKKD